MNQRLQEIVNNLETIRLLFDEGAVVSAIDTDGVCVIDNFFHSFFLAKLSGNR